MSDFLKDQMGFQVTKRAQMVLFKKNCDKLKQLPLSDVKKKMAIFVTESLTNADTTDEKLE